MNIDQGSESYLSMPVERLVLGETPGLSADYDKANYIVSLPSLGRMMLKHPI